MFKSLARDDRNNVEDIASRLTSSITETIKS